MEIVLLIQNIDFLEIRVITDSGMVFYSTFMSGTVVKIAYFRRVKTAFVFHARGTGFNFICIELSKD